MMFLGVVCVLASAFLSVLGVTMQKLGGGEQSGDTGGAHIYYYNSQWIFGTLLYIVSQPLYALALVICPFCIVAPLNCTGILVASIVSSYHLGEKYTRTDVASIVLGMVGIFGILLYGPHGQDFKAGVQNCKMLLAFWRYPRIRFTILSMCVVGLLCGYAIHKDVRNVAIFHSVGCAIASAFAGILLKVLATFVSADGMLTMNFSFVVALLLFCFSSLFALWLLGLGSRKFNNRFFMPSVNMLFSLVLQFFGAVAFREFESTLLAHCVICFLFSCICFSSVCIAAIGSEDNRSAVNIDTAGKELGNVSDFLRHRLASIPDGS